MMVLLSGRLAASKASAWHEWKEGDGRREKKSPAWTPGDEETMVDKLRTDLEIEKMAKLAAEAEVKRITSAHEVEKKTWLDRCKALEADREVPAAAPRPQSLRLR